MNMLLVLTNLPDRATAEALATVLVEDRLAACVNILQPCRSVYRWQGAVETAEEVPLLIKTSEARYAALENAIRVRHPYETPEIIAVPVALGLPDYLAWVMTETWAETLTEHWPSP
ncbi:MAG: divalent-cation tolerance protein CutA [Propionivibrio sp.]|uniref:divalent-cation tolerance protein CutA n=1 Tax=Propionivibrio sp. TaxID=2212460 RepID=UPI001A4C9BB9|nr:divalent-cation tolerance protein CutA [Propionivibrio sp.]MBL8414685.1 divalent-cation tolerance protein CutA [Propionivibrio sp.]